MQRLFAAFVACVAVSCGGLLGLGIGAEDDEPAPASTSSSSGGASGLDASSGGLDGSTAVDDAAVDVDDAAAAVDASNDASSSPALPRLARFEQALIGGDGADEAVGMVLVKPGALRDTQSAATTASPAFAGFDLAPQTKLFVSFTMRIDTAPVTQQAAVVGRLSGGGAGSIDVGVASNGTFGLDCGGVKATGAQMTVGTAYRVGIEADPSGAARATFAADNSDLGTPIQVACTSFAITKVRIGAVAFGGGFAMTIDDVALSTTSWTK